ncbi:MAG: ATP-binding domain-containing protein, partial [Anaerolineales bacterium]|nr:ATP-binding domain-containing protein [Anaerolineales bacterium]
IGAKTFAELIKVSAQNEISPGQLLLRLGREDPPDVDAFSTAAGKRLTKFGRHYLKWRISYETLPPVEIVDLILSDIDYRVYLEDGSSEGYDRWENIVELRGLASEYQTVGLLAFLEDIALVSDQDTLDPDLEVPTLLTLHAAKGLEFNQVMIIGLNEGILPHQRSFEEPEAMEEERRLLYVGITRARDRLYLFHSLNRYTYGYFEPMEASRYYRDIPPDLRVDDGQPLVRITPKSSGSLVRPWKEIQKVSARPASHQIQYHPGEKVKHSKWGEGLVLNSVLQDDDEIIDIFFEGVGKKKLIASLADLKKIG